MKTASINNTIVNSPNLTATSFGIKEKNLAKIINIVENDIYSDKILAVIREYSCNAYDANVFAGKRTTPIQVYMPSRLEPHFKVRDNGLGLSETDIKEVYTSYGESTKSDSNDFIGALGVGSKSGFAYGDNFVVTSFHNGTKTVYNAAKSAAKREIVRLYSEPSSEPSGIEVSIPVKHGDDQLFVNKTLKFFKYWDVFPEIFGIDKSRIEENLNHDKSLFSGTNWYITKTGDYSSYMYTGIPVAVMGNISYPVNWELVKQKLDDDCDPTVVKILRFITLNNFVIRFNIGDLEIAPSREALQYTDYTVNNIINRLNQIKDELEHCVINAINDCKTLWESKKKFTEIFGTDNFCSNSELHESFVIKNLVIDRLKVKSGDYVDLYNWDANCGLIDLVKIKNETTPFNYVPVLTTVGRYRSGHMEWKAAGHSSSYNSIVANSNHGIIIMDMDRKTHIKACVHTYAETHKLSKVYLLKFKNDAVKDAFFKENDFTGADHFTKLSDIFPNFKASLPKRATAKKVEDDCVSAEMYNPNTYFYRYNRRSANKGTLTEVDLSEKGYYLYVEDGYVTINNKKLDVFFFKEHLYTLSKIVKFDVEKVFLFGPKIKNGKKFIKNSANWTDFIAHLDTFVKNKFDLKNNIFSLVFKNEYEYVFSLNKNCVERVAVGIQDKNNVIVKLNDYLPTLKYNMVGPNVQQTLDQLGFYDHDGEYTRIKLKLDYFYNEIKTQYPMILFTKTVDGFKYIDGVPSDSDVERVINYVNSVDKLNGKV